MKYLSAEIKVIAKAAWAASNALIEEHPELQRSYPSMFYAREVRSISIKLPRKSGHTTAAACLLNEKDAVLIVPTYSGTKNMEYYVDKPLHHRIWAADQIVSDRYRGVRAKLIIVDGSEQVQESNKLSIVQRFQYDDPFYVWLA